MTPGELIRKEREKRGWTLKDLEQKSGVNYSRVSRIERGDGASDDVWKRLAKALNLKYTPAKLERK